MIASQNHIDLFPAHTAGSFLSENVVSYRKPVIPAALPDRRPRASAGS